MGKVYAMGENRRVPRKALMIEENLYDEWLETLPKEYKISAYAEKLLRDDMENRKRLAAEARKKKTA